MGQLACRYSWDDEKWEKSIAMTGMDANEVGACTSLIKLTHKP
jgi:hypothetical protein